MTLDEAIKRIKEKMACDYNISGCDTCNISSCEDRDIVIQLAEWLEELKTLREEKSDFQIMAKDIAEGNYEMGMENGYNKAIDDAKSVILQTIDNEILVDTLHLRLEQLKERNNE